MKILLSTLFSDSGYSEQERDSTVQFFSLQAQTGCKDYFFVDYIDANKFREDDYNAIANAQELFQRVKIESGDIEKNSSFLLAIKVSSFQADFSDLRNRILKIEENDFWFKKYIILYTDTSLTGWLTAGSPIIHFGSLIQNADRFLLFQNDPFIDEEYFLAVQLYLKLPYLIVPISQSGNYRGVQEKFDAIASDAEKTLRNQAMEFNSAPSGFDWDRFAANCLSVSGDDLFFTELTETFS